MRTELVWYCYERDLGLHMVVQGDRVLESRETDYCDGYEAAWGERDEQFCGDKGEDEDSEDERFAEMAARLATEGYRPHTVIGADADIDARFRIVLARTPEEAKEICAAAWIAKAAGYERGHDVTDGDEPLDFAVADDEVPLSQLMQYLAPVNFRGQGISSTPDLTNPRVAAYCDALQRNDKQAVYLAGFSAEFIEPTMVPAAPGATAMLVRERTRALRHELTALFRAMKDDVLEAEVRALLADPAGLCGGYTPKLALMVLSTELRNRGLSRELWERLARAIAAEIEIAAVKTESRA